MSDDKCCGATKYYYMYEDQMCLCEMLLVFFVQTNFKILVRKMCRSISKNFKLLLSRVIQFFSQVIVTDISFMLHFKL